jgi:hypothetical protein
MGRELQVSCDAVYLAQYNTEDGEDDDAYYLSLLVRGA